MTIEIIEKVFGELNALKCKTEKEVEEARVRFLGKKGEITALFEEFRSVSGDEKRAFGRPLNELKQAALAKIEELRVPKRGPKRIPPSPASSMSSAAATRSASSASR